MSSSIVLGIEFFKGSPVEAVEEGLRRGLVVVPSAPVLVDTADKPALRDAMHGADLAITDSGLMVLMWWLLTGEKLVRVSGLEYLTLLLQKLGGVGLDRGGVVWVMPTLEARDRNLKWLQANGQATKPDDCYIAPLYPPVGPLFDRALLEWVQMRQPRHIIICLGGGVQERLGYFLKRALEREVSCVERPTRSSRLLGIHCVGAAIGFLSGDQVRIPMWADYLYLGWLFRCFSAPRHFVPRYWKAARLVLLLWRYRKDAPPV